uniref:sporulation protein YunB n=1 Tax=Butyricicoccus sp. TaxID=2049021 RepID=UPI003D7CD5DD
FRVVSLGCVTAQVESHFSSAGINQTLYEASVTVSADFSLQLLGAAKSITVRANYPLEETILVGDVPMISSNSK